MGTRSVTQPVGYFAKLVFRSLCVTGGCIQVLVAEDLGQAHKIILIVGKELMCHRVPQQVRMQLDSADRTVLVAQITHPSIS